MNGTWPSYRSHKVVTALRIVATSCDADGKRSLWVQPPGSDQHETFAPTEPAMAERVGEGDWAIIYPDGFRSVSPHKAFAEGYRMIDADQPAADAVVSSVVTADNGDGTATVHIKEPGGTRHRMKIAGNHGALKAHHNAIAALANVLGERSTEWDKEEPKPAAAPDEPVAGGDASGPIPSAPSPEPPADPGATPPAPPEQLQPPSADPQPPADPQPAEGEHHHHPTPPEGQANG